MYVISVAACSETIRTGGSLRSTPATQNQNWGVASRDPSYTDTRNTALLDDVNVKPLT